MAPIDEVVTSEGNVSATQSHSVAFTSMPCATASTTHASDAALELATTSLVRARGDGKDSKHADGLTIDVSFVAVQPEARTATAPAPASYSASVPQLVVHSHNTSERVTRDAVQYSAHASPRTAHAHAPSQGSARTHDRERNGDSASAGHHNVSSAASVTREQLRQQQAEQRADVNNEPITSPKASVYHLLKNVIVHNDRPLENLPVLTPPELKIIGRCVTFTSDTNVGGETKTLHYEGLVGTINKDTVMLMNVYRFTEEDYAVYKETQQKPADVNKYTRGISTVTPPPQPSSLQQQQQQLSYGAQSNGNMAASGVPGSSVVMTAADVDTGNGRAGLALEREENEALSMVALKHPSDTLPHARGRLKSCPATTGPIPYMTFMRNHIQNVKFGNDPPSSFYSLFRDPAKRYFDMQCLRMFVRRYIVHTSQGNNPRNVPMRAFVVCRCNCPDLDEDLLESVLFEELVHLVKVDRDMKRAQRRRARLRRNSLLNFRAPRGIFRDTGVLYLTGLPRQTLSVAAFQFVLMIGLVVYYGVMTALAEPYISYRHLFTAVPYLCACAGSTLVSSMLSVLHSVRMSIPLSRNYDIVLCRLIMVTVALGCSLLLLIVAAQSSTLDQTTLFIMRQVDQDDLCSYYLLHQCSGITQACNGSATMSLCQCDAGIINNTVSCRVPIMTETQRVYVPLVCFALALTALTFSDHFLHYRLFHSVRLIMQTQGG